MSDVVYLLGLFVQQLISTFYLFCTGEPKKSFMFSVVIWFVPMAATYGLFGLMFPSTPPFVQAGLRGLILLCFVLTMFGGSLKRRLIQYFSFYALSFALEFLTIPLAVVIFDEIPNYGYLASSDDTALAFYRIVFTDVLFLGYVAVIMISRRKSLVSQGIHYDMHILSFFVTLHFMFLVMHSRVEKNSVLSDTDNLIQLSYQTLMYTLLLMHYFGSLRRRELIRTEQELEQLRAVRENEYRYYQLAEEKFDEISKLRHEMQNQLTTAIRLMNEPDGGEQAERILSSMQSGLLSVRNVNYCDDRTVNAVLTVKLSDERLDGINVTTDLHGCKASGLEPVELCSLFSNLFDNAVEACLRSEKSEGKYIALKSGVKNGMFVLRCENSSAGSFSTMTSKGKGHGYGLRIVNDICQAHGGELTISSGSGSVKATAVIELPDGRETFDVEQMI